MQLILNFIKLLFPFQSVSPAVDLYLKQWWSLVGSIAYLHLRLPFSTHRTPVRWMELLVSSSKQRRKGKIHPFECRVPKNSKER